MSKQSTGTIGEELAVKHLLNLKWKILGRNVYKNRVEADILAQDGKTTVIVEVKTKNNLNFGLPQEMVGYHKQEQLRRFAEGLLSEGTQNVRIDVIAVNLGTNPATIEHLRNAVGE